VHTGVAVVSNRGEQVNRPERRVHMPFKAMAVPWWLWPAGPCPISWAFPWPKLPYCWPPPG
jgi:hypothetical protein